MKMDVFQLTFLMMDSGIKDKVIILILVEGQQLDNYQKK